MNTPKNQDLGRNPHRVEANASGDRPSLVGGGPMTPLVPETCENTDRELWREREGDYYSDSIHVTKQDCIGINCGGHVFVKRLRDWHRLATAEIDRAQPVPNANNDSTHTP